jgi:hypothetical protein
VRRLTDLLGDLSDRPGVARALLNPGEPAELDRLAEGLRAALAELQVALADLGEIATIESPVASRQSAAPSRAVGIQGPHGRVDEPLARPPGGEGR